MPEGPVQDYEQIQVETGGQDVLSTWYPAHDEPDGKCHGSAGICVNDAGKIVLITQDGTSWGFPGGRPEDGESWEDTMRREIREEACVEVAEAQLLGFHCGECIRGHEEGLVLVRSIWLAHVQVNEWVPEPETLGRKLVPTDQVLAVMTPDVFHRLHRRALIVSGLIQE